MWETEDKPTRLMNFGPNAILRVYGMDIDFNQMTREELIDKVKKQRQGLDSKDQIQGIARRRFSGLWFD